MMTKEGAINLIIDDYKDGNPSAMSDYCDRVRCADCPFDSDICTDEVSNTLIDRLLKAEEYQETNLEHYWKGLSIGFLSHNNEAYESYRKQSMALFDWLFAPYEEPKPTYKLSKFEYDLLEYHSGSKFGFRDFWILEHMQDKGYFKDIPTDVPIRDIIENCEVTDDDTI